MVTEYPCAVQDGATRFVTCSCRCAPPPTVPADAASVFAELAQALFVVLKAAVEDLDCSGA